MTDQEADDIMRLCRELWPARPPIPDLDRNDLTKAQLRVITLWRMGLAEYPFDLVHTRLQGLWQRTDRCPMWAKMKEWLGTPPRTKAERLHCNVCRGEGLADIILDRQGGAFPGCVYTGVCACLCTSRTPDRYRKQIEQRMDRARNIEKDYHLIFERDVQARKVAQPEDAT